MFTKSKINTILFYGIVSCIMPEEERSEKNSILQADMLYFISSIVILAIVFMMAFRNKTSSNVSAVLEQCEGKSLHTISIAKETSPLTKSLINEKQTIKMTTLKEKVTNNIRTKINLNELSKDPFQDHNYLVSKFREDVFNFTSDISEESIEKKFKPGVVRTKQEKDYLRIIAGLLKKTLVNRNFSEKNIIKPKVKF